MSFVSLVVFETLIISDRTFFSGQPCIYTIYKVYIYILFIKYILQDSAFDEHVEKLIYVFKLIIKLFIKKIFQIFGIRK